MYDNPVVVDFPLRGEWTAPNTPGYKIPSHGTDQLGQRYAYDFMQIDWSREKGFRFYDHSAMRYILKGIPLKECMGWAEPFYAPINGEVVEVNDGVEERDPVHFVRDMFMMYKNAFTMKGGSNRDLIPAIGNYVIIRGENDLYAFMAHAKRGSIRVAPGDAVSSGEQLGEVGHAGNSTAPHLHFHLMDSQKLMEAKGIHCCFRQYEHFIDGQWHGVEEGIPGLRERVRSVH